jgi:hypothetical protein
MESNMRSDYRNHPYGFYRAGNSIVYFDRRYRPIVRVDDRATVVDSLEWIEHSGKEFLYSDGRNPPSHNAETRRRLKELMDSIPVLGEEVQRRNKAERRMRTLPPRRWSDERHTPLYGL